MKTKIFTLVALTFIGLSTANAQVGIGTTSPDPSAQLELQSTEKGFLPSRLTTAQRDDNIVNPAEGLLIYNTSVKCLQWWVGNAWHDGCGDNPYLDYPDGTVFCASGPTELVEVTGAGGRVWMDRNLGASQVATSSTDAAAYGDLYQWGRAADGHQCRTSGTTATNATTAVPNAGNSWDGVFITESSSPNDWLTPQDNNLWQGVNGTNNPCPAGFRLPTETEWNTERSSWSSNNAFGAFASPLKLPMAGARNPSNGSPFDVGSYGHYWSSTFSGAVVSYLVFYSTAFMSSDNRANGFSVRCLKD